jgi:hypothetical protein
MFTHQDLLDCMLSVLNGHEAVLALAFRQRAKFEGWLKLELAVNLAAHGARSLVLEAPCGAGQRADLGFTMDGVPYLIELKTANTNWRLPGVAPKTRPITKNISGIVTDARKLMRCQARGFVAFVLFPLPVADYRWAHYLQRVSSQTGIALSEDGHCRRTNVRLPNGEGCEAVVCCFSVSGLAR